MMINYRSIQELIDTEFEQYVMGLLSISGEPRKYFYWSVDFFETVGSLSFKHFGLSIAQKERINNFGKSYFKSNDVQFIINKNSHRNDITIKNIHKLFSEERKSGQTTKYEYIKEYILWDIFLKLKEKLTVEIDKLKGDFSNSAKKESDEKKEELNFITEIISKQKINFLITYISYLCNEHSKPIHKYFTEDYINYLLTNQGEELSKKIEENSEYDNKKLKDKINRLFVLKEEQSKIHFVFSRVGGGEKEELRELLEIMGKKDTGKLYRGQADSSWVLDASITREQKFLTNEAEMYYEVLSLKPDAFQNDQTIYERLITMQHYGMPTRLLDITRNPLVAIFFACNNWEAKKNDGTIYTFEQPKKKLDFLNFEDKKLDYLPNLFNHIVEAKSQKEAEEFLSKVWFIRGVAKNQRINNQSGDFIFVGNGDKVNQQLHDLPKMSIIIDSQTKKILLEQLESLNIHGGAVYPDLTNLSTYIKYKYENKPLNTSIENLKEETKSTSKKATKKVIKKQPSTKQFNFKTIKGKSRKIQLTAFSKFYNLDSNGLEKLVNDILFTSKSPLRDEVIKVMTNRPVLKDRAKTIDALTEKIITLSKMIGKE